MKLTITSLTALLLAPLAMLHSVGAPESQLQPASPAQGRPSRPSVGAIRWDAWSGGRVTEEVQRTLGPAKYHDRLPWFAEVKGDNQVRIDGSQPGIMDREINFAADAGLDYWAFLLYPESDAMSLALQQYLKSPQRQRLNFCVILHNSFGVPEAAWPRERARLISLLKEPGYQTVLGGRPLVFEFQARLGGKFPRQRFADFRQAAREAGLNPYCVFMGWSPAADFHRESTNGFDAVSAYASGSDAASYAELAQKVETGYWLNAAAAKIPYVPLVTTGWDKQPRKDHPVSWEKDHSYHRQAVFPARATPAEIASHLQRALTFVREHEHICAANTSIIYAWNEHDEGGWLSPTWALGGHPNTSRLDAIREVLSARKASQNPAEFVPKPISPRPAKVTVGPRELIRARDNMPFVMDSTLATLRRDQGSWFFYHTVDWGKQIEKWRGTPSNPFEARVWQKSRDELFDLRGQYTNLHHAGLWLLNIHRLPDGNLLGVAHIELHPGPPAVNSGEKYALGLVFSEDGGDRWVYCGEIVRPQDAHGNVGGAPLLVVGDYFHVYFNEQGPSGRRAAVARAPVADVLKAARRGSVTPWRKFSDGAWEQDGLTGYGAAVLPQSDLGPGHPIDLHADAAWSRALGQYMVTSWCFAGGVGRLRLHLSDDAIHFEPPILVDEESGQWMPYSTFLTVEGDRETDDMNAVGAEFFLLINHKSATNYSVNSLWRRKITVSAQLPR